MKTYSFATLDELNNTVERLSAAARSPDSGRFVTADGDGWIMSVPDEFVAEVDGVDLNTPVPDRRPVPKSVVMQRLTSAGKIGDAFTALMARPDLFGRWFAPDRAFVNAGDVDTIAFLTGIGADPTAILAPPASEP